jgi:hypothetical protein
MYYGVLIGVEVNGNCIEITTAGPFSRWLPCLNTADLITISRHR